MRRQPLFSKIGVQGRSGREQGELIPPRWSGEFRRQTAYVGLLFLRICDPDNDIAAGCRVEPGPNALPQGFPHFVAVGGAESDFITVHGAFARETVFSVNPRFAVHKHLNVGTMNSHPIGVEGSRGIHGVFLVSVVVELNAVGIEA